MTESPNCGDQIPFQMGKGFRWRVAVSIIVPVGWLIFLIIWFGFYAIDYTGYQNLAIFLVSILVMAAILGPIWAVWGMKMKTPLMKSDE